MEPTKKEKRDAVAGYILLWFSGILIYPTSDKSEYVRFHAKQSVLLFLPLTIITVLVYSIPTVGYPLSIIFLLLLVMLWLICMIMVYQGKVWRVPFLWNIAEKIGIKAERPKSKDELYSFALFQFVTKTSEVVGEESLQIFRSAVEGYNKRFNRDIKVGTQISFSNVSEEEWPQLARFVLDVYAQCIGPVAFDIARDIDGLKDFAA